MSNPADVTVSVCMASYNGASFIAKQIHSILSQLSIHDELIIVDDHSDDDTFLIVSEFNDTRIRLYSNASNIGVVRSLDRALTYSSNDLIILADQDDVWPDSRISFFQSQFCS